jgi:chitinase
VPYLDAMTGGGARDGNTAESPAVDASGDESGVGGRFALTVSADSVAHVEIRGLWTDWELLDVSGTDGTVTDSIAEHGTVTVAWAETRASVSFEVVLTAPNRYVGGTFETEVVGVNNGTEATATAAVGLGLNIKAWYPVYRHGSYPVEAVPFGGIDRLGVAFLQPTEEGGVEYAYGETGEAAFSAVETAATGRTDLLAGVGGAGGSENYPVAASPANREAFVTDLVDGYVREHGLDGIEHDWEFPTTESETDDFVALLETCREQLDAAGAADDKRYLQTCSVNPSPAYADPLNDAAQRAGYADFGALAAATCDWINVMTYDYAGPWSTLSGHQAPLYAEADEQFPDLDWAPSVHYGLRYWTEILGVAPERVSLGLPAYANQFVGAEGPGESYDEHSYLSYDSDGATSVVDISDSYEEGWDADAEVPYLTDDDSFVSIPSPESWANKAADARQRGIAGLMYWEDSQDQNELLLDGILDGD